MPGTGPRSSRLECRDELVIEHPCNSDAPPHQQRGPRSTPAGLSGETHGLVLTKPHMVELILDLAGYAPDRDLARMRLLEPACGHGAFLVSAIGWLMTAAKAARVKPDKLADCVRVFDIDEEHVAITRAAG